MDSFQNYRKSKTAKEKEVSTTIWESISNVMTSAATKMTQAASGSEDVNESASITVSQDTRNINDSFDEGTQSQGEEPIVTIADLLRKRHVPTNTTNTDGPNDDSGEPDRSNKETESNERGNVFSEDEETASDDEILDDEMLDDESQNEEELNDVWNYEKEFNNEDEIQVFLKAENTWSLRSKQELASGTKSTYRCNKVKRTGVQCIAGLYILAVLRFDNNEENAEVEVKYQLYRKSLPHNHDLLGNKSKKVTPKVKDIIIAEFNNNKKPTAIGYVLRANATIPRNEQPNMRQIKSTIESYKKALYGKDPITMKALTEFVQQHLHVPVEDDTAFITMFERSPSDQQHDKVFRFFISTKRLLKNAENCKNIHADATYKITIEKLPLIVVGTTDINKTFHLIGFLISSDQTANAYELAFKALQAGMIKVNGKEFHPEVLICDADRAIHKGWRKVFTYETKIIMCFFHVMHNVNKYKYTSNENKEKIKSDMRLLHLCYDEQLFEFGCELFIEKWKSKEVNVIKTIEKSFINKNKNWFIGAHFKAPKTNNALERFNGTLKLFQTDYVKKPLKQFIQLAMKMIQQRSREYEMDKKGFQTELLIPKDVIKKGIELGGNYIANAENENGEVEFYMFSSNINKELTQVDIDNFKVAEYDSFESFVKNAFIIWKIIFPKDLNDWKMATCTCPAYDNHFICKHIVSIAHKLGLVEEDTENYDEEPLFVNQKGKPKRASKALVMD